MGEGNQVATFLGGVLLLMALSGKAAMLKVGDRAPDFALPDQDGKITKLSDYLGKHAVVLAFYVRASTPG